MVEAGLLLVLYSKVFGSLSLYISSLDTIILWASHPTPPIQHKGVMQ